MEDKIAILEAKIRNAEDTAKQYQEHAGRLLRDVAKARAELERERRKAQEPPKWPALGDIYWFFYQSHQVSFSVWNDAFNDKLFLEIGNCFPTKEAAEFASERLKVLAEMKQFAFQPDWSNKIQEKWAIYYNHASTSIKFVVRHQCDIGAPVYFGTRERAEQCVTAVGEDRLLKYFFGVEEQK